MAVVRTQSEIVFACHSAACRPPTSGGTGGSNSKGGGGSSGGRRRNTSNSLNSLAEGHSVVKGTKGWQVKGSDGKVVARAKTKAALSGAYSRSIQRAATKSADAADVAKSRARGGSDVQGPSGSFHPRQKGNTPVGQWGARFQGGQQAAGEALTKNGAIGTVAKARGGYRATYKNFGSKETKATFPTREDARKWVEASVNNVTGKHGGASSRPPSPRNFGGKAGL